MKIFDGHCDVLYRLKAERHLSFAKDNGLHITHEKLKKSGGKVQCFALFVSDDVPEESRFSAVLEMIDIFHKQVIEPYDDMVFVKSKQDIDRLKEGQTGALLTLEGCDAIGKDMIKLRTLFRLGVRSVGLTWNHANAAADGATEPRAGGLTGFGFEVVKENNLHKVWTDVSHLSERSFWDVIETADYPIASHSNARALCDHPRNLTDQQIKALIDKNSVMGITFVPDFLTDRSEADINDILRHVEHVCELGGENIIAFGSDFDGISETPKELRSFADYHYLAEACLKYYPEKLVRGFFFEHFYRALPQ
ncbi:membrane dipeptidase [Scopulibacillus daqui]|uniref:Membrane dipeptidase n=1 Tax=Scopulibacillus daqui TaxID=1469162 RepID=A0ABS2PWJ3_9BACL|nr:dipeptidase [Scopulibacillus daqui]MBM7644418.1 membrane dipeptidase [Scopulibacillus daqui]